MLPVTRILMVRHGESEWNAQGRWQGLADPPLSERGERQAAEASAALGVFDGVWSSQLQRAAHTASIICETIGVGPVQIEPRLRETDVGPWQGLTAPEVEHGWPGYLAGNRRPEGFEDYDDAARRAMDGLQHISAVHEPGSQILVVSHSGVIRSLARALGGVDRRLANLCGHWFSFHQGGRVTVDEHVDLRADRTAPPALAADAL